MSLCDICRGDPCGRPIIRYTQLGQIALETISDIEKKMDIRIDKYVIMPNHIHMIIFIEKDPLEKQITAGITPTIGKIIGGYKSVVAKRWLDVCKKSNVRMGEIWQRSYYDHIIRNEYDYRDIWNYIDVNPDNWTNDELNM